MNTYEIVSTEISRYIDRPYMVKLYGNTQNPNRLLAVCEGIDKLLRYDDPGFYGGSVQLDVKVIADTRGVELSIAFNILELEATVFSVLTWMESCNKVQVNKIPKEDKVRIVLTIDNIWEVED